MTQGNHTFIKALTEDLDSILTFQVNGIKPGDMKGEKGGSLQWWVETVGQRQAFGDNWLRALPLPQVQRDALYAVHRAVRAGDATAHRGSARTASVSSWCASRSLTR